VANWQLQFNVSKYNLLHIGKLHHCYGAYNIQDNIISASDFRGLGVTVGLGNNRGSMRMKL